MKNKLVLLVCLVITIVLGAIIISSKWSNQASFVPPTIGRNSVGAEEEQDELAFSEIKEKIAAAKAFFDEQNKQAGDYLVVYVVEGEQLSSGDYYLEVVDEYGDLCKLRLSEQFGQLMSAGQVYLLIFASDTLLYKKISPAIIEGTVIGVIEHGYSQRDSLEAGWDSSNYPLEDQTIAAQATCISVAGDEVVQLELQHSLTHTLILHSDKIEIFTLASDAIWQRIDQGGLLAVEVSLYSNQENEVLISRGDFSAVEKGAACKMILPLSYLGDSFEKEVYFER